MTPTEEYIRELTRLKLGELGLLRAHTGQGIDESVEAFDLFSGLWWPLRQASPRAPRREVAWLIAKLYAGRPMPQSQGATLARLMRVRCPARDPERKRYVQRFDALVALPVRKMEPALRLALDRVAPGSRGLDWVRLTDDLSRWNREETRMVWVKQFTGIEEREESC